MRKMEIEKRNEKKEMRKKKRILMHVMGVEPTYNRL